MTIWLGLLLTHIFVASAEPGSPQERKNGLPCTEVLLNLALYRDGPLKHMQLSGVPAFAEAERALYSANDLASLGEAVSQIRQLGEKKENALEAMKILGRAYDSSRPDAQDLIAAQLESYYGSLLQRAKIVKFLERTSPETSRSHEKNRKIDTRHEAIEFFEENLMHKLLKMRLDTADQHLIDTASALAKQLDDPELSAQIERWKTLSPDSAELGSALEAEVFIRLLNSIPTNSSLEIWPFKFRPVIIESSRSKDKAEIISTYTPEEILLRRTLTGPLGEWHDGDGIPFAQRIRYVSTRAIKLLRILNDSRAMRNRRSITQGVAEEFLTMFQKNLDSLENREKAAALRRSKNLSTNELSSDRGYPPFILSELLSEIRFGRHTEEDDDKVIQTISHQTHLQQQFVDLLLPAAEAASRFGLVKKLRSMRIKMSDAEIENEVEAMVVVDDIEFDSQLWNKLSSIRHTHLPIWLNSLIRHPHISRNKKKMLMQTLLMMADLTPPEGHVHGKNLPHNLKTSTRPGDWLNTASLLVLSGLLAELDLRQINWGSSDLDRLGLIILKKRDYTHSPHRIFLDEVITRVFSHPLSSHAIRGLIHRHFKDSKFSLPEFEARSPALTESPSFENIRSALPESEQLKQSIKKVKKIVLQDKFDSEISETLEDLDRTLQTYSIPTLKDLLKIRDLIHQLSKYKSLTLELELKTLQLLDHIEHLIRDRLVIDHGATPVTAPLPPRWKQLVTDPITVTVFLRIFVNGIPRDLSNPQRIHLLEDLEKIFQVIVDQKSRATEPDQKKIFESAERFILDFSYETKISGEILELISHPDLNSLTEIERSEIREWFKGKGTRKFKLTADHANKFVDALNQSELKKWILSPPKIIKNSLSSKSPGLRALAIVYLNISHQRIVSLSRNLTHPLNEAAQEFLKRWQNENPESHSQN